MRAENRGTRLAEAMRVIVWSAGECGRIHYIAVRSMYGACKARMFGVRDKLA